MDNSEKKRSSTPPPNSPVLAPRPSRPPRSNGITLASISSPAAAEALDGMPVRPQTTSNGPGPNRPGLVKFPHFWAGLKRRFSPKDESKVDEKTGEENGTTPEGKKDVHPVEGKAATNLKLPPHLRNIPEIRITPPVPEIRITSPAEDNEKDNGNGPRSEDQGRGQSSIYDRSARRGSNGYPLCSCSCSCSRSCSCSSSCSCCCRSGCGSQQRSGCGFTPTDRQSLSNAGQELEPLIGYNMEYVSPYIQETLGHRDMKRLHQEWESDFD